MRSIFTLAGLLIVAGIIMWSFSRTEIPSLQRGQEMHKEAEQLAGREADGTPVSQSLTLEPQEKNNKLDAVLVKDIVPGSAMQKYYGLTAGDEIIEVGPMAVRDMNNDGGMAVALVQQAYQQQQALVVRRAGQQLTLPSAAAPGQPPSPGSAAEQQLNNVKIPTH